MKDGKQKTIHPTGPLVADNSEVVLQAAIEGAGMTFVGDWLAGPALRAGKLVEILLVDEISKAVKAGWATKKRS